MNDGADSELSERVQEMHLDNSEESLLSDFADLPNILIVTNIAVDVFDDSACQCQFEAMFRSIDQSAEFQYLKSFRRARVVLQNGLFATKCRIQLNDTEIANSKIKLYFAQPKYQSSGNESPHLHPPIPEKQFLISPPASPPVGWEPVQESEPVINYDLLAAVTKLAPGEAHELHPRKGDTPGIIVHVCEDPPGYSDRPNKIIQTRRPDVT